MSKEDPQEFVDRMLADGVAGGASDMYFIPGPDTMNVRRRINGLQQDITIIPREFGERCTARLKVLAGLLTYRTRIAQDGAIRGHKKLGNAELRISVMPTSHGERVSIRVLQGGASPWHLDDLGFPERVVEELRSMLKHPAGMIVLTGPTGCGKTTTIYALIRELLKDEMDPSSIITIEDPIECEIENISQVSSCGEPGWGYAPALRSALRHDVKTLIVGEMRDQEVVRVTLDAALTGHRVITTYHAGDIPSVYARLLHQGFEPFLISSAITGVLSERLVKTANGEGRVPIVAVMTPDDQWRDFITRIPELGELRKKIKEYPGADLAAVAGDMIRSGIIPPDTRI